MLFQICSGWWFGLAVDSCGWSFALVVRYCLQWVFLIRVFGGGGFAMGWLWLLIWWWWFYYGFLFGFFQIGLRCFGFGWVLVWVSFGLLVGCGSGCVRTTTRIWFNI